MKFKYSARTQNGELQAGLVEAVNHDVALNILASHNLYVLSLSNLRLDRWYDKFLLFFKRVKLKDVTVFTRQLSILLESKVSLGDSLRFLHTHTKKPILKEAVSEIAEDVRAGLLFSQALERQAHIFSEFYVSALRPAEVTGRLEEVVKFLAAYLEKESRRLSRIRNAMIYPSVVVVIFLSVVIVLLTVVFPQLKPIFEESGVELPLLTKILLGTGDFILRWWPAMMIGLAILIFAVVDYLKSSEGRAVLDEVSLRLPVFGELFKKIYTTRFSEAVGTLIRGGVPLVQGLEVAGHSIGNRIYSEIFHQMAEGIRQGETMASLLSKKERYFPPLVGQMVEVGETSGKLEEALSKVSEIYTHEVDDVLDNLVELIQPALITIIGVFVGLLFASILLPIYKLAGSF